MSHATCDLCKTEIEKIYSIPLNKSCTEWVGTFCSTKCALLYIDNVCDPKCMPNKGSEERKKWFKEYYKQKNNSRNK